MLRTERQGPVVVWTLDRPEARNALSFALVGKLQEALALAKSDATIRAGILTGAGGAFASGGDLQELRDRGSAEDAAALSDGGESICRAITELPFPVIAALGGPAIGGGAELALACDMRIAEDQARICFKQARMGVTTAWGSMPRLVRLLGPSAAARVLFTSQELTAVDARAMGLIDFVAEPGSSVVTALAWCQDIAAGAPRAIAEMKALLWGMTGNAYALARSMEREAFVRTWSSPEHAEAMTAYFSRRAPKW